MKRQVITVLSNAGSTSDPYTITIPMSKATTIQPPPIGTSYTEILTCGTTLLASTNDLIVTLVSGMSQVPSLPRGYRDND